MFWGVAEDRNPVAATPLRTMTLVAIPLASFRASPAARADVARTAAPLARCAIHRSAWKGNSPKFACSIPHSLGPLGRETELPTVRRIEVDTTCCGPE
jgi:hypothetical protein